ncbi:MULTISPECIES: hypothetical protein [Bacillus cereus group]|uniref:hypothetical protein n=2 Tax=Bacillus cereus group TaxID=86661 RepID=UPI00027A15A2|nr:hypothetical protein [Bacillus cereus]EJR26478.1 hypothetical protein IIE_06046 [Bacillus cereus VD045]MDR5024247.1 hypothetical protein [Bacillus thuringiensis]HDR4350923.1 hypothetical protein [Bacillus cereus]HDR6957687.1 hypothetical protein [Bacillus cereus]
MFMLFRACQSIDTRYLVKTYIWGILIYLFFRWVIPPYETGMINLMIVNFIFFPFARILAHKIKCFFFSDTIFMMTDKGWLIYLFIKASFLGWLFVMTPIFAPFGFLIVFLRFWKMERKRRKNVQKRNQNFAKA